MGIGVVCTVGWTKLEGWALVQVMPVTLGPAPPAALCLYQPARGPPCSLSLGFDPQSLWTGVGSTLGSSHPWIPPSSCSEPSLHFLANPAGQLQDRATHQPQ